MSSSPEVFYKVPEEMKAKIDETHDFVITMKSRIEQQFKRWLSPKEASAYMGVSQSKLTGRLKNKIKPIKDPDARTVKYDVKDLDKYWEDLKESN